MLRLSLLTAALTLALATPALADSIAYVQGGNVFLSSPMAPARSRSPPPGSTRRSRRPTTARWSPSRRVSGCTSSAVTARCWPTSSRRSATARRTPGRSTVSRPVQPADLARRHESRLRVLQRLLRDRAGVQRDDGAAVRGLQAVARARSFQHRRLHAVRDLRPAVGLDLPDLARRPVAAALGPGRSSTTTA